MTVFRLALPGVLAASVAVAGRESGTPKYSAAAIAVESKLGAGDILNEKPRLVAPNITADAETGTGRWTDDQLVRAIRQGHRS